MADRACLSSNPPARRRLAGKKDRQFEQCGERKKPPEQPTRGPRQQTADQHDTREPPDPSRERFRRRNQPGDGERRDYRDRYRRQQYDKPQGEPENAT